MQISVNKITVERTGRTIFSELSFKLMKGQLLYITGQNGSGKSTLLRTIGGLIKPVSGSIDTQPFHTRPYVYSGHQDSLKSDLTVEKSLVFWSQIYNYSLKADAIINTMGLDNIRHIPIRALSAGWRKRVSISRLALSDSPIWLLDEPYASLDNANIAFIEGLIEKHIRNNGLAVIATHQFGSLRPSHTIEMENYDSMIKKSR